jgi:Prokaryotic homologs of the JAB domain
VALAPFLKIVVDKKEEGRFRRRALYHFPLEHMEALWGQVRGDTLYICAFVPMNFTQSMRTMSYDDTELDEHEEDAKEAGYTFLGTIHTHPNCKDTRFGDTDLEHSQDSQEDVMGICAIETLNEGKKTERKKVRIEYWPTVRPLQVVRKEWDESTTSKTSRRVRYAGKKSRYAAAALKAKRKVR